MARYYFNIKDGEQIIPDPDGDELPDETAVLGNIRRTVADILHRPDLYGGAEKWVRRGFVVTDDSGRTVMKVPVPAVLLLM